MPLLAESSVVVAAKEPASAAAAAVETPKKLKPCCACPETKKERDQCVIEKGEKDCSGLIEAHKACMRSHGFEVA